jgi:hypothetical protein
MTRSAFVLRLAPLLLLPLCACGGLDNPKKGVSVAIESPSEVKVGETFEIRAIVDNKDAAEANLDSIDIGDSYLEGITLESSQPAWIGDTFHIPVDNTVSHEFQAKVPPGTSFTVTFKARATKAGRFAGDFDICVNSAVNCFFEHISTEVR